MKPLQIIAHRGYARCYPENTLSAIEAALAVGANAIEVDVQLSADHVPVLFHDATLQRLCGDARDITDLPLSELKQFHIPYPPWFGSHAPPVPPATLQELVDLLRGQANRPRLFVEVKLHTVQCFGVDAVLDVLLPILNACEDWVLISYSLALLTAAHKRGVADIGLVCDTWGECCVPEARALQIEYLFCDVDGLPVEGALCFGDAETVVFEVDTPAQARALHARGVNRIETFAVAEMLQAFGLSE